MAASQKATWEAPSFAELAKLVSPTTNRIWVRTRSRSPSSRLSPVGPLEGIAHYSGGGAFPLRGIHAYLTPRGNLGAQVARPAPLRACRVGHRGARGGSRVPLALRVGGPAVNPEAA